MLWRVWRRQEPDARNESYSSADIRPSSSDASATATFSSHPSS